MSSASQIFYAKNSKLLWKPFSEALSAHYSVATASKYGASGAFALDSVVDGCRWYVGISVPLRLLNLQVPPAVAELRCDPESSSGPLAHPDEPHQGFHESVGCGPDSTRREVSLVDGTELA